MKKNCSTVFSLTQRIFCHIYLCSFVQRYLFSLVAFKISSVILVLSKLIIMFLGIVSSIFHTRHSLNFLDIQVIVFIKFRNFSILFKYFSVAYSCLSLGILCIFGHLKFSHSSLMFCLLLVICSLLVCLLFFCICLILDSFYCCVFNFINLFIPAMSNCHLSHPSKIISSLKDFTSKSSTCVFLNIFPVPT